MSHSVVLTSIPLTSPNLSVNFVAHLLDPALRSLFVAGVAAVALLVTRSHNHSVRLPVWRVVLAAALAMPLLAWYLPRLPVPVPGLDRVDALFAGNPRPEVSFLAATTAAHARIPKHITYSTLSEIPSASVGPALAPHAREPIQSPRRIPWNLLLTFAYLAVAVFLIGRLVMGWMLSRRLRDSSHPIRDHQALARFRAASNAVGLRSLPALTESARLCVPLTCGVLRPAVLLPAAWREWDDEKLDAVFVHELSHVARHDAFTERLALFHRVVFWFSPLAWWLRRHLSELAEEASDRAALASGTARAKYAEILLEFLADLQYVPGRVRWQGVAMAQAGRTEKRLEKILDGRMMMSPKIRRSVVAVAAFVSLPLILLAASLQPGNHTMPAPQETRAAQSQQASAPAPAAPAAPSAPSAAPLPAPSPAPASTVELAPVAPLESDANEDISQQVAPLSAPRALPTAGPLPTVEPLPPLHAVVGLEPLQAVTPLPRPPSQQQSGYSYFFSTDSDEPYAIVSGKSETMSGSFAHTDFAQLEALRASLKTDFIWFERDGKPYVITDPELVKRATEAFALQAELGRQQGELGERQGSLGEVQGDLGQEQGALGEQMGELRANLPNLKVEVPDMTVELQALTSKTRELRQAISQKDMEEIRSSMAQMQKELAEAHKQLEEAQIRSGVTASVDSAAIEAAMKQARSAIDEQMARFAAEQAKLGAQQAMLGKEQAELGRQQAKAAAKAEAEIKTIIDEALARGVAQPAPKQ